MAAEEDALADEEGLRIGEASGCEVAKSCLHEPESLRRRGKAREERGSQPTSLVRAREGEGGFLPVSSKFVNFSVLGDDLSG